MNEKIIYKEFGTVKEFRNIFKNSFTDYMWDHIITREYFWEILKTTDNNIVYTIDCVASFIHISKSKIGYVSLGDYLVFFYIENKKIYTITIRNYKDFYFQYENKLYHLTHGPKAISIPDAFKVLAL